MQPDIQSPIVCLRILDHKGNVYTNMNTKYQQSPCRMGLMRFCSGFTACQKGVAASDTSEKVA